MGKKAGKVVGMKHSIPLVLLCVACTGERFGDSSFSKHTDAHVELDAGNVPSGDASTLPPLDATSRLTRDADSVHDSALPSSDDSGMGSGGRPLYDSGDQAIDSGSLSSGGASNPPDSGARLQLTCPSDVSHCNGKAWNGNTCAAGYGACCHETLCWCCLGG